MQTMEAVARRKSTRDFDPNKPVTDDEIEKILEAGCQAPIAGKPGVSLHLTVCKDRSVIDEINQMLEKAMGRKMDFSYGAPVVIFVSAAPEQMSPGIEKYNTACVIENMLIAATDCGLENIYLWGAVQQLSKNKELCDKMGIPEGFTPISAAGIGHSLSGQAQPRNLSVSLGVNYI